MSIEIKQHLRLSQQLVMTPQLPHPLFQSFIAAALHERVGERRRPEAAVPAPAPVVS